MERKPRIPTQKRSLEKYNRIIDAAFKLFNEKGYYNTTTADIAKEANVATGSVYSYFEDKKDIYIQVLRKINDNFNFPTQDFWLKNSTEKLNNAETAKSILKVFLKLMLEYHNFSKVFHDEMVALQLVDKDINAVEKELTDLRMARTYEIFNNLSIPFKSNNDLNIFLHYSYLLIDDVCHKTLYDNTVEDLDLYVERVVDMIYTLFENTTDYK